MTPQPPPPSQPVNQGLPPPGWYPDPGGAGMRYWDGTGWTQHVAPEPPSAPPPPQRTSGFAIASLVFGILGGALFALVFGYIALSQIRRAGGRLRGRGVALTGVVLGWIWLGILLLVMANH